MSSVVYSFDWLSSRLHSQHTYIALKSSPAVKIMKDSLLVTQHLTSPFLHHETLLSPHSPPAPHCRHISAWGGRGTLWWSWWGQLPGLPPLRISVTRLTRGEIKIILDTQFKNYIELIYFDFHQPNSASIVSVRVRAGTCFFLRVLMTQKFWQSGGGGGGTASRRVGISSSFWSLMLQWLRLKVLTPIYHSAGKDFNSCWRENILNIFTFYSFEALFRWVLLN